MAKHHGFVNFGQKVDDLADTEMRRIVLELGVIGKNDLTEQRAWIEERKLHPSILALIQHIWRVNFLKDERQHDLVIVLLISHVVII